MRIILFAAAAAAVLASGPLLAQTVVIAPEQRTVIKEYIVKEKIRPYKLQSRVTVGATLPADVELAPVPETWGPAFRTYRYVYTGDDVVLVEPSTRRVVEVID
jgi:hypothetical protein